MATEDRKQEFEEGKIHIEEASPENPAEEAPAEEETSAAEENESAEEAAEAAGEDGPEETPEEDNRESGDEEKGGRIRGRFGRKDKKELARKDAEIADLKDRYMRTLAEYENFRKRTEKEKADIYSFAVRDVMGRILPVLDNLERGVAAVPEDSKDDPFASGMEKILRQFEKALDDIGVKPIEAAGKTFDPNFHNAVMHVDDESLGANVVAEELMKGYTYRDSVVRHSMVKVAN